MSLKGKRLLVVFQAILIFLKFLPAGVSEYLGILALGLLERLHATELWKLGSGDRRTWPGQISLQWKIIFQDPMTTLAATD